MSEHYTKAQSDAQAAVIGGRIKTRTSAVHILSEIAGAADANVITDAERTAISNIPPNRFKGVHANLAALRTAQPTGAPGDYATLANSGADDTEAIWDADANDWIDTGSAAGSETPGSVKAKYESNANTNPFTDADKSKLDGITDATNIADFTAALDAALA